MVETWYGGTTMPVTDFIHDAVRNALVKDGWTITADPYTIEIIQWTN